MASTVALNCQKYGIKGEFAPPKLWWHSCIPLLGKLFIFGGCSSAPRFEKVWCLDASGTRAVALKCKSDETAQQPQARAQHAAVRISENQLVLFGGFSNGKVFGDFWIMEAHTKTGGEPYIIKWSQPLVAGELPSQRFSHSLTKIDGSCYVFGGSPLFDESLYQMSLNTFESFKMDTVGQQPEGRADHSMTVHEHSLFLYGGCRQDDSICEGIYEFNISTSVWSLLIVSGDAPLLNNPRAVLVGSSFYFVCGNSECTESYVNIFDICKRMWLPALRLNELPFRHGHAVAAIGSQIFVHGGWDINFNDSEDLFGIDVASLGVSESYADSMDITLESTASEVCKSKPGSDRKVGDISSSLQESLNSINNAEEFNLVLNKEMTQSLKHLKEDLGSFRMDVTLRLQQLEWNFESMKKQLSLLLQYLKADDLDSQKDEVASNGQYRKETGADIVRGRFIDRFG